MAPCHSLHVGPGGNIIVSFHYINQVVSIASDWKSIQWRLGGVRPTIAVPADQQTSAQHTAAELSPNRILMFDNRTDLQPPFSRAVEYQIEGPSARQVWQWKAPNNNYAAAVSSARRLGERQHADHVRHGEGPPQPSGPTETYEVAPDGTVRWHLVVGGVDTTFRVEPINSFEP